MKRLAVLLAVGFACLTINSSAWSPGPHAQHVDAPIDVRAARNTLERELTKSKPPLRLEYQAIQARFLAFNRDHIEKIFGPKLVEIPKDHTLPIFALSWVSLPDGTSDPNPWVSRNHQDIHSLGNTCYIQVWYKPARWQVAAVVFYNRVDDEFVRYTNRDDLAARWGWDEAKFKEMKVWLNQHVFSRFPPLLSN